MPQRQKLPRRLISERIAKLQDAMKEFGLQAVVLEPGPAMMYLTGVRWGKSERTFAVVLPAKGDPVWVLPGFEEMRARELIRLGQRRHSRLAGGREPVSADRGGLKARGVTAGRVGIDERRGSSSSTASANWRPSWTMSACGRSSRPAASI